MAEPEATTNGHTSTAAPPSARVDGESSIIGVSICNHCRARFRIQQKYQAMVGKSIRCPKCHQDFVIKLEQPTPVEQAAITNASAEAQPAKRRKKRTKLQMRKHHLTSIKKAMRPFHTRLSQLASQEKCSEEQIRVWCLDVLRDVLGYKNEEIDTELSVLGERIDIALMNDGKVFMVIECKNARSRLTSAAINQAVKYAANKSADWAVVTSGHVWKLFRVCPVKGADPKIVGVFDISLLDADGVSDSDVANLYRLTRRSVFTGETETAYHRVACLSDENMLKAMATPRVLKALRRSLIEDYAKCAGEKVRLGEDDVEGRLQEICLPADLSDSPSN